MPDLQDDEKLCPYCAEIIKKAAVVCKHCRRGLQNPDELERSATTDEITNLEKRGELLKKAVADYMTAGWLVSGSTDDAVQMVQQRKFDWGPFIFLVIIGFFTAFIPPFIYIIWWSVKKPVMVVLTVDKELNLLVNGVIANGPPAPVQSMVDSINRRLVPTANTQPQPAVPVQPQTPEEKAEAAATTKRALLIIGVAVALILIFFCGCYLLSLIYGSGASTMLLNLI